MSAYKEGTTFIVFARNEAEDIIRTINSVYEAIEELDLTAEVFVIDDGSADDTPQRLEHFSKTSEYKPTIIIQPPLGISAALRTALANAQYSRCLPIPGHYMFDKENIIKLLKDSSEADVVIGIRSNIRKERPLGKFIAAVVLKILFRFVVSKQIKDPHGLIIYPTSLLNEHVNKNMEHENHIRVLAWAEKLGLSFSTLEIEVRKGHKQESKIKGRPSAPRIKHLWYGLQELRRSHKIIR